MRSPISVWDVAFHGARAPRAFNIITDALRNMSSEPYVRTDNGIFYSGQPGYSYEYTSRDGPLRAWEKSQLSGRGWSVLFGLEVALAQIPFEFNEHSTDRESTMMIRYIFLLPSLKASHLVDSEDGFPLLQIDQNAMKKAYETLDQSALSSRRMGTDGKQAHRGMPGMPKNQEDTSTRRLDSGRHCCMDVSWSRAIVFRTKTSLLNSLGDNSPVSRSRVPYGESRLQLFLENKID